MKSALKLRDIILLGISIIISRIHVILAKEIEMDSVRAVEPLIKAGDKSDRTSVAPFDTNIRKDCRELLRECQSEFFGFIFLQCPLACSAMLEAEGMIGRAESDDDLWWEQVETVRTREGKRMSTDRWDGYVTVLATLPMIPGMAVYYYEMMEILHSKFAPHVEMLIIPIDVYMGIHMQVRKIPRVVVLEETTAAAMVEHPFVKYLTAIKPTQGAVVQNHRDELEQIDLHTDRVTFFIISADAHFVERLISPTMEKLQRRIALYLRTIDYAGAYTEF